MIYGNFTVSAHSQALGTFLELHQGQILDQWLRLITDYHILSKHTIDPLFFIRHFGSRVYSYFIGVCRGENEVGDCPAINVMLDFFKKKYIPIEDIYILCAALKNTVVDTLYREHASEEHQHLAHMIFDNNFAGVLSHYIVSLLMNDKRYAIYAESAPSVAYPYTPPLHQSFSMNSPLSVQMEAVVHHFEPDDFEELVELEEEIIYFADQLSLSQSNVKHLVALPLKLGRYAQIVRRDPNFIILADALQALSKELSNPDLHTRLLENQQYYALVYQSFVYDLVLWRLSMQQGTPLPNNHVASMISNANQFIALIGKHDQESGDIEFF